MIIEIEEASIIWTLNYTYSFSDGNEVFETDYYDSASSVMTEWRYDIEYRYRITFLCDSEDDAVRSLSLFDDDHYFEGAFKITRADGDHVKFFEEDRPFHEYHGRTWIVYFGETLESGYYDEDAFLIEIDVYGRTLTA